MFRCVKSGITGSLLLSPVIAAGQSLDWSVQFGTSGMDGAPIAVDANGAGGVVVSSHTTGELVAGAKKGGLDAWVAGFDRVGAQQWVYQFGTPERDSAQAVMHDGADGAIAGGFTLGSLFAPNAGDSDIFIARYSASGGLLWGRQFGSDRGEVVHDFAPDGAGGFFVMGDGTGDVGGSSAGGQDIYVARYTADGDQMWIRQTGTPANDGLLNAAADATGGLFVCGFTDGFLAAPPSSRDAILLRYDADGTIVWTRQFGSAGDDWALCAEPDGAGGCYVGGFTDGSLAGPRGGRDDAWIARYDGDGNQLWIRQFGLTGVDRGRDLAQDGAGGVYFVGSTTRLLFDAFVGGGADAWATRYTATGDRIWELQFGTTGWEFAYGVAPDGAGGVIVGGATDGAFAGPSAGLEDAWLARFETTCYPDCDASGGLDFFDFLCFQNLFATGDPLADCDGNGILDFFDFLCFQNDFAMGCS